MSGLDVPTRKGLPMLHALATSGNLPSATNGAGLLYVLALAAVLAKGLAR